jgi:hypothetical protein
LSPTSDTSPPSQHVPGSLYNSLLIFYLVNVLPPHKVPMNQKKILTVFAQLLLALLLVQCAGQIPPPGGPEDRTPPAITRTFPDTNATRVVADHIELEFSEYVDRRSAEESIFISPYVGHLEFDWSGTEVEVRFSEQLRKNTTYVVTVGTDVVDYRARNRMASGFTLAFSTGDSIDHGAISGRVFDEKPEGIMIFAYQLHSLVRDTLNPARVKPDYIMQTGKDGGFTLSNIAMGEYRVFAIRDQYKNLLYDRQVDQFGCPTSDVVLTNDHPRIEDVWFRMSEEDTSKPFLSSIQVINRNRVNVRFSEPVDTVTFSSSRFEIRDTLRQVAVEVKVVYLDRTSLAVAGVLTSTPMDSGVSYRITVAGIFDRHANPLDSLNASAVFVGNGTPDTVNPVVSVLGVSDSARSVPIQPRLGIAFSEPVLQQPVARTISLRDSAGVPVDLRLRWLSPADVSLGMNAPLRGAMWYKLTAQLDSVSDFYGNSYRDSTFTLSFQTIDLRTTGVIEGTVADDAGSEGDGPVYLTAVSVDVVPPFERSVVLERPGRFSIDQLVEGRYVLKAFRDLDRSQSFSYGRPFPFVPAERFLFLKDTVKVRARWNVEGVLVKFKSPPSSGPAASGDQRQAIQGVGSSSGGVRGGSFVIEIGTFKGKQSAAFVESLTRERFKRTVLNQFVSDANVYRVILEGFSTQDEAQTFLNKMMTDFPGDYKGSRVVPWK